MKERERERNENKTLRNEMINFKLYSSLLIIISHTDVKQSFPELKWLAVLL